MASTLMSSSSSSSSTDHILEAYDLLSSTRAHHIRSALGAHVTGIQPINATTSLVSFDTRAHAEAALRNNGSFIKLRAVGSGHAKATATEMPVEQRAPKSTAVASRLVMAALGRRSDSSSGTRRSRPSSSSSTASAAPSSASSSSNTNNGSSSSTASDGTNTTELKQSSSTTTPAMSSDNSNGNGNGEGDGSVSSLTEDMEAFTFNRPAKKSTRGGATAAAKKSQRPKDAWDD